MAMRTRIASYRTGSSLLYRSAAAAAGTRDQSAAAAAPSAAGTRAAAAPSADGASRRTRGGCGGRRRSTRPAAVRAGSAAKMSDLGGRREQDAAAALPGSPRRSRRPRCRGSTARRAGPRPRQSARYTSRHAPLTQSTYCSWLVARATRRSIQRNAHARSRPTVHFCRSSASGEIIGPNDSSVRPAPSTSRGPATAAVGAAASRATSASTAPAGTMLSLFSSRISSPLDARMPALFAAENPAFLVCSMTWTRRPAGAHGVGAAVVRRVVDDDDLVRSPAGGAAKSESRQRSRSPRALKLTMTIDSRRLIDAPRSDSSASSVWPPPHPTNSARERRAPRPSARARLSCPGAIRRMIHAVSVTSALRGT